MYLVSFDIIHSFGSQIVHILRINFIIISLLHVLPAGLRANYEDSFLIWDKRPSWLLFHMNIDWSSIGSDHQCPVNYHWITISVHLCPCSKHCRMPAADTMQTPCSLCRHHAASRKWVRSKLRRSILYRLWIFGGCCGKFFPSFFF